jgi:hypothetical protein
MCTGCCGTASCRCAVGDAGWLLVGILLGVLLTVVLVEWHDGHTRRQRRHRTRAEDRPATQVSSP